VFGTLMARLGPVALLVALSSGCGGATRVTGEVTYDGQSVGDGRISFLPADGKGPPVGGSIVGGRYTIENIAPGPKVVTIEAVKKVPFARSSAEMAKMAAANKAKGDGSGLIDPADAIPANAVGNNEKVEITTGEQTRDFHLRKPADVKERRTRN
jgi:hypothetical protein